MGEIYSLARRLNCKMDGVSCEISLQCTDDKNPVVVGCVHCGDLLARTDLADFVSRHVRAATKPPARKQGRRTVVMYDGGIIKTGMNGVTLVPRNPTRYDARWNRLAAEADRQERDAIRRENETLRLHEENVRDRIDREMVRAVMRIRACSR